MSLVDECLLSLSAVVFADTRQSSLYVTPPWRMQATPMQRRPMSPGILSANTCIVWLTSWMWCWPSTRSEHVSSRCTPSGEVTSSSNRAYWCTYPQGIMYFRKQVASFIEARDGHQAYPHDIFFISMRLHWSYAQLSLTALVAIMTPLNIHPLYSLLINLLGGCQVDYNIDEAKGWNSTRL